MSVPEVQIDISDDLGENNNYNQSIYGNDIVEDNGLKEIPNTWLNRLLPSTEPMQGVDWQSVFGRVFFLDDHGVFRPLEMERALAGEMSHFKDLTGLPYNVGEILQQFTSLPLSRIHHYANTGEYLRALFNEKKLVDALIHVQDKVFAAHRVALACHSVYFARAFILNQHQKHRVTEIRLKNTDPYSFNTVLRFIYTGQLYVNINNVDELLNVANQLQIPAVLFKCLDFLGHMPLNRAIDVVGDPNPQIIREKARRLTKFHLREVIHNDVFLTMGIEAVEMALGSDDVLIDSEKDVFYAAMAWLAYEIGPRRKYLERLMRQVRFTCMTPAEVIEATQVNNLIRNSPYCRNRVLESIWLMTIKGFRTYDVLKCHCPKPRACLLRKGPYAPPHHTENPYDYIDDHPSVLSASEEEGFTPYYDTVEDGPDLEPVIYGRKPPLAPPGDVRHDPTYNSPPPLARDGYSSNLTHNQPGDTNPNPQSSPLGQRTAVTMDLMPTMTAVPLTSQRGRQPATVGADLLPNHRGAWSSGAVAPPREFWKNPRTSWENIPEQMSPASQQSLGGQIYQAASSLASPLPVQLSGEPADEYDYEPSKEQASPPSSQRLHQPSGQRLYQPSSQQLHQPSGQQLYQPSSQQLHQSSGQRLYQPSSQRLYQPSSQQLHQQSSQQFRQASSQKLYQPSAQQLHQSSAQQLHQPSAQHLRQASPQKLYQSSAQQLQQPANRLVEPPQVLVSKPSSEQMYKPSQMHLSTHSVDQPYEPPQISVRKPSETQEWAGPPNVVISHPSSEHAQKPSEMQLGAASSQQLARSPSLQQGSGAAPSPKRSQAQQSPPEKERSEAKGKKLSNVTHNNESPAGGKSYFGRVPSKLTASASRPRAPSPVQRELFPGGQQQQRQQHMRHSISMEERPAEHSMDEFYSAMDVSRRGEKTSIVQGPVQGLKARPGRVSMAPQLGSPGRRHYAPTPAPLRSPSPVSPEYYAPAAAPPVASSVSLRPSSPAGPGLSVTPTRPTDGLLSAHHDRKITIPPPQRSPLAASTPQTFKKLSTVAELYSAVPPEPARSSLRVRTSPSRVHTSPGRSVTHVPSARAPLRMDPSSSRMNAVTTGPSGSVTRVPSARAPLRMDPSSSRLNAVTTGPSGSVTRVPSARAPFRMEPSASRLNAAAYAPTGASRSVTRVPSAVAPPRMEPSSSRLSPVTTGPSRSVMRVTSGYRGPQRVPSIRLNPSQTSVGGASNTSVRSIRSRASLRPVVSGPYDTLAYTIRKTIGEEPPALPRPTPPPSPPPVQEVEGKVEVEEEEEEVPFFKFYTSQFDGEDVEGRVTGVEVGFRRRSVSPSGKRRHSGSDAETKGADGSGANAADPFSGGDILAVGGYIDQDNKIESSHAQRLDNGQKSWEKFSEMPETRFNFAAAFLDGKLYVVGGYDPSRGDHKSSAYATKETFRFDPKDQKWERGGSMRNARAFHAVCTLGGRLYALGGQNEDQEVLNSGEVYDPGADRWSSISSLCQRRVGASAVSFRGRVMVLGGYGEAGDDSDEPCPVLMSAESYDPSLNRWKTMGDLRQPRAQACVVEAGGCLYLCGGATRKASTGALCSIRDVDRYQPDTDTWSHVTDLQIARHNAGATAIGSKVYVVGGVSTDTNQVLRSVECYDSDTGHWDTSLPDLLLGAKSLACVVISDDAK